MATPIFIVGTNRSGTTWLANIVSSHTEVASIQSDNHHQFYEGVIESFYFSHVYGRYGDIKIKQNYIEFVEAIGVSDYFKLAGATKDFLYSLYPTSYDALFRCVMDRFSENQKKEFWIEKSPTHSMLLNLITSCYPDAKIIAIQRDCYDVVLSNLGLKFRYKPSRKSDSKQRLNIIRSSVKNYFKINKTLHNFSKHNKSKMLFIKYEDLINNYDQVVQEINDYIGFSQKEKLLSKYSKNTSFTKDQKKSEVFNNKEKIIYSLMKILYSSMPYFLLIMKDNIRKKLRRRFSVFHNSKLPNWFYNFHEYPKAD